MQNPREKKEDAAKSSLDKKDIVIRSVYVIRESSGYFWLRNMLFFLTERISSTCNCDPLNFETESFLSYEYRLKRKRGSNSSRLQDSGGERVDLGNSLILSRSLIRVVPAPYLMHTSSREERKADQ